MELKITQVPIDDIQEYRHNAKLHPEEQIDRIAKSIIDFGFNDPIAVWHNEDGKLEVVEGHGRLKALKKLHWKTVPVIMLDHLSDYQRRAYTHIHNQLAMVEGFDMDMLAEEIAKIDIDLGDYGFDFGFDDAPTQEPPKEAQEENEDMFDVLFVCHTAEEKQWLADFLQVPGELRQRYEFKEVF